MQTAIIILMIIFMGLVILFWYGFGKDMTEVLGLLKDIRNTLQEIQSDLKRK